MSSASLDAHDDINGDVGRQLVIILGDLICQLMIITIGLVIEVVIIAVQLTPVTATTSKMSEFVVIGVPIRYDLDILPSIY